MTIVIPSAITPPIPWCHARNHSAMTEEGALVNRMFDSLVEEAARAGVPEDVLGRLLIDHVVRLWSRKRSYDDIRSELLFVAENVDPDTDHEFMRP